MRKLRIVPLRIVPVDGLWEANAAEDRLTTVQWITLVLGVVLTMFGITLNEGWPLTLGVALITVGLQIWVLLTVFRAWRHESRHQTAAVVEPRQPI